MGLAYFDNAATTFPKPNIVYEAMNDFYKNHSGSFGRGNYAGSMQVGMLVADTRKRIQQLFHCPAKQVIFTPSATIALNIVIQGKHRKSSKAVVFRCFP